uniref:Uncharacterized protein n=1 Tax=Noccaea caerulescens TaxID=107243 RepID=A0A1J3K3K8_NOCCA
MEDDKIGNHGVKKGFEGGATVKFFEKQKTPRINSASPSGVRSGVAIKGVICYLNTKTRNFAVTTPNGDYHKSNLDYIRDEEVLSTIAPDPEPEHQLTVKSDADKEKVGSDSGRTWKPVDR